MAETDLKLNRINVNLGDLTIHETCIYGLIF